MSVLPLTGLTVVALEQAVAAPFATSRLADAGARVIKIERPEGDFARRYDKAAKGQSSYFVWLNRGKESRVVDLAGGQGKAELAAELRRVRHRGYAVSYGQRIAGAVGIFAPVFDAQGQVVASLGYTIPDQRFERGQLPRLSAAARTHADRLSAALGHVAHDHHKEHSA